MKPLDGAIETIGRLIELTEKKIETLRALRASLAIARAAGVDPKRIQSMSRSEADLPPHVSTSSFFWPYDAPFDQMWTRVKLKGEDEWRALPEFINTRTGEVVARRARKRRAVPRSIP